MGLRLRAPPPALCSDPKSKVGKEHGVVPVLLMPRFEVNALHAQGVGQLLRGAAVPQGAGRAIPP